VSEPRAALSSALIAGLIVAAGVVTWSALAVYRRPAADSTATIGPAAGTVARPAAISDMLAAPPPSVSAVAVNATGAVVDTAQQDQRQAAKITRGLTANPSGGILVEAAPSGTVASQLRLEAGDVIVSVNGSPVRSPEEFARIYREQGLPRQMTVIHNGREMHHH
jgi:S1-C subfamily serine protease